MIKKTHDKTINVNISSLSIIKVIIILAILWFLWMIKGIIGLLFVALILTSAFDPFVDWMQKRKIPRALGMLIIYIVIFGLVLSSIGLVIPPIIDQVGDLTKNISSYTDKFSIWIGEAGVYTKETGLSESLKQSLESLQSGLATAGSGVVSAASSVFGGVASFVIVIVITFYMIVQEEAMKKVFRNIAPAEIQPYLVRTITRMKEKIGLWLRGQLVLCLIVGILTFAALFILGLFTGFKYALVLALLAGIFELVPYLGPIFSAVPAVFLGFMHSPLVGLIVLLIYIAVQQTENHVLVPKIMQKAVGLNPIISITVLLIGMTVAGFVGVLLAIPVATALSVIAEDFFEKRKTELDKLEE